MISAELIGVEQIIISKTSWRNIKRKLLDDIRRRFAILLTNKISNSHYSPTAERL